jgi:RimJ/RimL family protein N-acetyltransferase
MIIRELRTSDSDGLSECYAQYYEERDRDPYFGLTLRPTKPTINEDKEWFSQFYQGILEGNNVGMVAEEDSHIIGFCEIRRIGIKPEVSHRADLGISVRKEYRGKGVGTALLSETLKNCKDKFEIIELEVFSTNNVAKRFYEKGGFKIFGLRPRSIKRGDIYIDEYLMSLNL